MEVDYFMMYPYVTFNDDTEITHSEMLPDDRVKVYIETPDLKDGFHKDRKSTRLNSSHR